MLILGREERTMHVSKRIYDLIYELNRLCPRVLAGVLPQLEFKLKSAEEKDRMGAVSLLAQMFSEKNSNLATAHPALWIAFLGRSDPMMENLNKV